MKNKLDLNKTRRILAKHINRHLSRIEPLDILQDFEQDREIQEMIGKLDGDITTNKEIEKFDDDSYKLIDMTIKNLKRVVTKEMPLWIVGKVKI